METHKHLINAVMGKLNHDDERAIANSVMYGTRPRLDKRSKNMITEFESHCPTCGKTFTGFTPIDARNKMRNHMLKQHFHARDEDIVRARKEVAEEMKSHPDFNL